MNNITNTNQEAKTLCLSAKNISHSFDYDILQNISLDLFQGDCVGIMGKSGCGKSTLLNILSSLLAPNDGEVFFDNQNIYNIPKNNILKIRRDCFGIVFQAHYLFRGFSAKENLQISQLLSGNKIDYNICQNFGIDKVLEQNVGKLSGGEQQRVSIARILIKKPKVIFADEPTGNLDDKTSMIIMNELCSYIKNNKSSLIIATHEKEIAKKCDRIYIIENKQLKKIK